MKNYTDIDQSKKLVELGIDVNTADMRYGYIAPYDYSDRMYDGGYDEVPYQKDFLKKNPNFSENEYDGEFPAWSLAALLEVLPLEVETHKQTDGHKIYYYVETYMKRMDMEIYLSTERHENLVDACVEMIYKLKEKDLL